METRIRKDIKTLSSGEKDRLILAFYKLQNLDPRHEDSFFQIAGYHGEPFRGAGYSSPYWWGGYCNHGNILFPTWHRAYLCRLEAALQKQVPGVMMAYWNEIDDETSQNGLPTIFLDETYTFTDGTTVLIDGEPTSTIPNPLHHYTFQMNIKDRLQTILDADYTKPAGQATCRFPFSGLFGQNDFQTTEEHNKRWQEEGIDTTNGKLNDNVKDWLLKSEYQPVPEKEGGDKPDPLTAGAKQRYIRCLEAPNYLVFSNTTSAERWNDDLPPGTELVVPIESPHNKIHLAIGGIQIPSQNASTIQGANGDMAENDTAAFDPIFFFHHAFIDRMFWAWQKHWGHTDRLEIDPRYAHYPGTNSVDAQGPTPGVPGNTWLSLDSPLDPFVGRDGKMLTSRDVTNISLLGYDYDSIPTPPLKAPSPDPKPKPHLTITGANRAAIRGSFFIAAWLPDPEKPNTLGRPLGIEAVLSRWHVSGCANCQNHLEVSAHVPLPEGWTEEEAKKRGVTVQVHTRDAPRGLDTVNGRKLGFRVRHV